MTNLQISVRVHLGRAILQARFFVITDRTFAPETIASPRTATSEPVITQTTATIVGEFLLSFSVALVVSVGQDRDFLIRIFWQSEKWFCENVTEKAGTDLK